MAENIIPIVVVDYSMAEEMDDAEVAVQNDMMKQILDVCGGQPSRRVLQVLIDTLACAAVSSGEELEHIQDALEASYETALPKSNGDTN